MQLPPQSTSVSLPFLTPSVQTPFEQSAPTVQTLLSAHLLQVPPPQSTSVSAPFFMPSRQVPGTHLFAWQLAFVQSLFSRHSTQLALPSQTLPALGPTHG